MIDSTFRLTQGMVDGAVSIETVNSKRNMTLLIASKHVTEKIIYTELAHLNNEEEHKSSDFIKMSSRDDIKSIKDTFLNGNVNQVVIVSLGDFYRITGILVEDRTYTTIPC